MPAVCWRSPSARLIGWGMYRWNQNRLDRKHAELFETAASGSA